MYLWMESRINKEVEVGEGIKTLRRKNTKKLWRRGIT